MPTATRAARSQQRAQSGTQSGTKFQAGAGMPWLMIIVGTLYGIYRAFRWLEAKGCSPHLVTFCAMLCLFSPFLIAGSVRAWQGGFSFSERFTN
eukprot:SAG31_NODE_11371_length_1037_cov_1.987207_1_plen_93_part_10